MNVDKSAVAPSVRVHFLGFRLRLRADRTVSVRLSKRTLQRLNIRIRELAPRNWDQSVDRCIAHVNQYLKGWSGYFRLCTNEEGRTLKRYDAHIRRRLRAIIVVQRKRPRFLFRHLVERGVKPKTAALAAWRRCRAWKKSNLPGLTTAYRNQWFHKRLHSLRSAWNRANPKATASGQALLPGMEKST